MLGLTWGQLGVGRPGLFVLIKDYAFLGTSAHESVITAGYLPDTCDFPLNVAPSPNASGLERNGFGPCWGRPGAILGLTEAQIWPKCINLGCNMHRFGVEISKLTIENC